MVLNTGVLLISASLMTMLRVGLLPRSCVKWVPMP